MTYNQLTTEIFIERAKKVHGNKYDYSKVNYVNSSIKVCIICPIHGEFWQNPASHLSGRGCPKCANEKKGSYHISNTKEFIDKAKKIYGDRFDYSKVNYVNSKTKVCIICPIHGEFWQEAHSHLSGRGCNLCSKPVYDTRSFIAEAKKIYGNKYDYSKAQYVDAKTKVCIICPKHGEFWVTPNNHLARKGCYHCGREVSAKKQSLSTQQFIDKAREVHGDKYDYSKVSYTNNHTEVCIICKEHGEFWQKPNHHLRGQGCPKCSESKLETMVRVMLEENNIEYIQECGYDMFKWLKKQRFDFYLPKYNIAIECQGEQHYFPVSFGCLSESAVRERFKNIIKYDKRKKEGCEKNGIKLLYFTTENLKKDNEFIDLKDLLNEIKNE